MYSRVVEPIMAQPESPETPTSPSNNPIHFLKTPPSKECVL